jgi:hypothetical protein
MSRRQYFRVVAAGLLFVVGLAAGHAADYGTKVVFKKSVPVALPDFVLTYLGARRATKEKFPRGFLYHDFRVAGVQGVQTVSWSSGTGDIAPQPFKIGDREFALELGSSDKLGRLAGDELVIRRWP